MAVAAVAQPSSSGGDASKPAVDTEAKMLADDEEAKAKEAKSEAGAAGAAASADTVKYPKALWFINAEKFLSAFCRRSLLLPKPP